MTGIRLTRAERQALLEHYHRSADPAIGHRAHILLLLDAGHPWATISAVLFCSSSTISRWKGRFEAQGVNVVFGRTRGRKRSGVHIWAKLAVRWVLAFSPTDFRFARSRWSCEAAALVLRDDFQVRVGRETVRLRGGGDGMGASRARPFGTASPAAIHARVAEARPEPGGAGLSHTPGTVRSTARVPQSSLGE